jgi:hypothetical protein
VEPAAVRWCRLAAALAAAKERCYGVERPLLTKTVDDTSRASAGTELGNGFSGETRGTLDIMIGMTRKVCYHFVAAAGIHTAELLYLCDHR